MTKYFFCLLQITLILLVAPAYAADDALPDAILYPGEKPGHIIVVDKASQVLYLYRHQDGQISLEKIMPCSTGKNKGDKLLRGDEKTPNGFYLMNKKLLPKELPAIYGTLAYPMDYPNFWDKQLKHGGDGIWMHGINKPLADYDSKGCVELENADIAQMEALLVLNETPIIVYEELSQKSKADLEKESQAVKDFIESWRRAWAQKDQDAYKEKYDRAFINSDGKSYEKGMEAKTQAANRYKTIKIDIDNLRIFYHRDVIVAIFEQNYNGDRHFSEKGLKRLYIKNTENGYKIVGEEFGPLPGAQTTKWLTAEEKRKAIETPPLKPEKPKDKKSESASKAIDPATENRN